jgi:alpha-L-rhamnosidase
MGNVAAPTAVRFEHRTDEDPVLGIGTATPRLSWIVPAAEAGFVQEAYEVELTRAGGRPRSSGSPAGSRCWSPGPSPR